MMELCGLGTARAALANRLLREGFPDEEPCKPRPEMEGKHIPDREAQEWSMRFVSKERQGGRGVGSHG